MSRKRQCNFLDTSWMSKCSKRNAPAASSSSEPTDSSATLVVTNEQTGSDQSASNVTSNADDKFPSALAEELKTGPFRPKDISQLNIPQQTVNGKTRSLQSLWFNRYPWLHYSNHLRSVLCYSCARATALSLLKLNTKSQSTFISTGFAGWKKALEKFAEHEKSDCHRLAIMQLQQATAHPIDAQLSTQKAAEQAASREALLKLFS